MVLIEIVIPDHGRRLYLSVDERSDIKSLKKRACEVVGPIASKSSDGYVLIEIDDMNLWPDEMSVKDAGLTNGSRMLLLKGG